MNDSSQPITPHAAPVISTRPAWIDSLLRPILAFRLNYMPVVMIYFTYGALGLIDVSRDLWIKEALTLNPAQLAAIAVLDVSGMDANSEEPTIGVGQDVALAPGDLLAGVIALVAPF